MVVNDPIADMLTRIRNAQTAGHDVVSIPASNMKKSIAKILESEGFVKKVEFRNDDKQGVILLSLKYVEKRPVIVGLKRISRPGLRVYARCNEIPKVLGGLGTAILSTPRGVMTDRDARKSAVGGEVLAFIW